MKKLLLIVLTVLITTNICYAEKNWFDIEVAKIRSAKETQVSMINYEIEQISLNKARVMADSSITSAERAKLTEEYTRRTEELTSEKARIEEQYKRDKAELKRRWKNGDTKNYSKTYTTKEYTPVTSTNEYKTITTTTTKEYKPINDMPTYRKEITAPIEKKTTVTTTTVEKKLPDSIQLKPKPEPQFKVILH